MERKNDLDIKTTLVCFDCGKKKEVIINRELRFAFELVQIADEVGMYGVLDSNHGRALVFCDKECAEHSKTKSGTYRAKPRKII
jgi:hypothetical protein